MRVWYTGIVSGKTKCPPNQPTGKDEPAMTTNENTTTTKKVARVQVQERRDPGMQHTDYVLTWEQDGEQCTLIADILTVDAEVARIMGQTVDAPTTETTPTTRALTIQQ